MIDGWINYLLITLLVLCAVYDITANKIPNIVTIPSVISAVALHSLNHGLDGFLFSTAGMATGIALLIIPYIMSGMGAGDVKLMGAVGSFLGVKATFEAFLIIALFGGVYAMALILIRRDVFKGFFSEKLMVLSSMVLLRQYMPIQTESSGQKPRLKYGVAIALGTITYLVLKSFGIKFLI
jgi:prepilin peptidase CpaA